MNVVFHHSNDDPELHDRVVGNIANLLDDETIDLDAVALVANSGGLTLLLEDSPQRERVAELQQRGVQFKQCRNTIKGTSVTEADLIDGVELVSSGVGELSRLQADGYAYLKP
ncbi:DsrE family protein [Halorarius halobius]|uniref:DsrE family protein n=1 Tax=Halorarius halobius TaxID=2962671 RepID=UPI0020CFA843|nr:DsrE family protein [Halorarius halobius]